MARPIGSKNSYRVVKRRGAASHLWKGGRRFTPHGYVQIHVGIARYRFEHDLIVEAAIGHPLLKPAVIHHVNEKKDDNRNENLVVCPDDAYHVELHRKLRVLRAGGDPWTDRLCCMCRTPRPAEVFYKATRCIKPFNPNGYTSMCGDCGRERQAARRRRGLAA